MPSPPKDTRQQNPQPNTPSNEESSLMNGIGLMVGLFLLLIGVISIFNTLFGWELNLEGAALPQHWDGVIGLLGLAIIWLGFWAVLTLVSPIRNWGRRHPWWTTLIVLGIIAGAIVGITIWDNANIAERDAQWAREDSIRQDSIRRDSILRAEEDSIRQPGDLVPVDTQQVDLP